MTSDDMMVIEQHLACSMSGTGKRLPVMLSKEYDRVDIDATSLTAKDACMLEVRLAQSLGCKGYLWDVWMSPGTRKGDQVIHVAEREEAG